MKCPNCGEEIANDSKYCESCGYKVKVKQKKLSLPVWIITSLVFITGLLYFYVDNPSAHSGIPEVDFLGRDDDGQLQFVITASNTYHLNYAWDNIEIDVSDESAIIGHVFVRIHGYLKNRREFSFDKIHIERSSQSGDANFYWSEIIELEPGEHYSATLKGTHKGILFNRQAKNVFFEFTTPAKDTTVYGIDFVYVKGEIADEHSINDFYLSKYEVTNEQWESVMGYIPSATKTSNHPVHNITYDDAQNFIYYLNRKSTKYHFRLPTKEEWKWAAHGGVNKETYRYSGSDNYDDVAWLSDNSGVQEDEEYSIYVSHTHPVGTKAPNSLGIYDMSGNVNEICSDLRDGEHISIGGSYWINYWWAYSTIDTPDNYISNTNEHSPTNGLRLVLECFD